MSLALRCYCCGETIGNEVALVTMSADSVDRVFVMLPEHIDRIDDGTLAETALRGKRIEPPING